jgi:hypothetical protein
VYFPQKPHPNGLEDFLLCSFVEHPARKGALSFILNICPHLQMGDSPPFSVIEDFMKR